MSVKRKFTTDFPVTAVKPDDEKDDQNGFLNVRDRYIYILDLYKTPYFEVIQSLLTLI